jgi:hypothetical protein
VSPEGTQLHRSAKRKSQDTARGRAVVLCPPNGEPGQRFGGQTPSKEASSWTQSEHDSQPRLAQAPRVINRLRYEACRGH